MATLDDLLTLERAGQLPANLQEHVNTLRAAGEIPPLDQPTTGSITTTPTTTAGPGLIPELIRSMPATVGAVRGAEIGGRLGRPFGLPGRVLGAVGGAGVGAAIGEGGEILGQQQIGVPQGAAPVVPRLRGAAESGAAGQGVVEGLKGLVAGGQWVGRRMMSSGPLQRAMAAAREQIPVGLAEVAPRLRRGLLGRATALATSTGIFGKQAVEQAGAVNKRLVQAVEESGGPLSPDNFAKRLQTAMRSTLNTLRRTAAPDPALVGSLEGYIGTTLSTGSIVNGLAKDAVALTRVVHEVGPEALQEMQRAWLTSVLESTTGKGGIRAGLTSGEQAAALWRGLGETGQQLLFLDKAPMLDDLFKVLETTHVSSAFGAAATTGSPVMKALGVLLAPTTIGAVAGYEGRRRGYLTGPEALGAGVATALAPYVAGKLLVSPGGIEFLTGLANVAHEPGLFRRMLPVFVEQGIPLIAQALGREPGAMGMGQEAAPPAPMALRGPQPVAGGRLGPFTLAAPPPAAPRPPRRLQAAPLPLSP